MKIKLLLIALLVFSIFIIGCVKSADMVCNYDGVCDDDETDNCPDCADILGRGVPIIPDSSQSEEINT